MKLIGGSAKGSCSLNRLWLTAWGLVLTLSFTALSDDDHKLEVQRPEGVHPPAESLIPQAPESETTLKAEDVISGVWKADTNGACDITKGCPFKNNRGETAYLPLSEKKRLEKLTAARSEESAQKPTQEAQNNKIEEVSTEQDLAKAFAKSSDKDVLVLLFGAENCGPCKNLQAELTRRKDPNMGIFLAERPDYASLSGNPLHTKFRNSIGNGVPVAFIYTKDEEGNWKGIVVKQSSRTPIMGAINSALASKKHVKAETPQLPRRAAQAPQGQAPQQNNSGMVSLEFSKKPGGGLMVQGPGQTEPEQVYLLERGVNERVAAFKNPDGTFRAAPSHIQHGLRKYYEEQASKVASLSTEKQGFVKQFLTGSSNLDSEAVQADPGIPAQNVPGSQAGNLPRPRPGAGRNPSTSVPGLIEANRNGNPGFSYAVAIGGGAFANCQATLVSSSAGVCMAATAAHCLVDIPSNLGQASCPITGKNFNLKRGRATIEMADFGRVDADIYVNPGLRERSAANNDSALISWACPNGPGPVPVIPISSKPLSHRESVIYGKVMGGKEGIYNGVVNRENLFIDSFPMGLAMESVLQNPSVRIQQGDSGGGLYRRLADGTFELVGVLSSKNNEGPANGNYATNRSLDFVKCVKSSIERPKFAQN